MIKRCMKLLKRLRCKHTWRPALKGKKPFRLACRVCAVCEKEELIPVNIFYAQFGRMPW